MTESNIARCRCRTLPADQIADAPENQPAQRTDEKSRSKGTEGSDQ
jgi:hypothetical protein